MRTKALARRLDGLGKAARVARGGGLLIVSPEDWPDGAWAAYTAARDAGDHERRADILRAQTGRHVAFTPEDVGVGTPTTPLQLIIIRSRPHGPQ